MKISFKYIFSPILFLTFACYVGEASLSAIGLPISSSLMYVFFLFSLLILLVLHHKFKIVKIYGFDVVSAFYTYLLLRNLTTNLDVFINYWLPNAITFLIIFLLCKCRIQNKQFYLFLKCSYIFTTIIVFSGLFSVLFTPSSERLAVFGGGPNTFYKIALLFHTFSFANFLFQQNIRYFVGMLIGLIVAIYTGSKGAIITISIILPMEYFHYLLIKYDKAVVFKKLIKSCFLVVVILSCFIISLEYIPTMNRAFGRASAIFVNNPYEITSVSSRLEMMNLSIEYFKESPLIGKGANYMRLDTMYTYFPKPYAHNIFLEMLGEQGIIGFILILCIIGSTIINLRKIGVFNFYGFSLFSGFLIYIIGAQFSGNILDSKMAIIFAEMIIVLGNCSKSATKLLIL